MKAPEEKEQGNNTFPALPQPNWSNNCGSQLQNTPSSSLTAQPDGGAPLHANSAQPTEPSSSLTFLTGRQKADDTSQLSQLSLTTGGWAPAEASSITFHLPCWWLSFMAVLPGNLFPPVHSAQWQSDFDDLQAEGGLHFPGSLSPPSAQLPRHLREPALNSPPAPWAQPQHPMACTPHPATWPSSDLPLLPSRQRMILPALNLSPNASHQTKVTQRLVVGISHCQQTGRQASPTLAQQQQVQLSHKRE